ncbi:hypothetical protein P8452_31105 [Trifolium repens]|nr:hypothetical protein P8452_31105 [Trifolium repens]
MIFPKTRVQPNGNDCGYYVMKNMIDIVSASVTKKWDEVFNDPTALSEDDLNLPFDPFHFHQNPSNKFPIYSLFQHSQPLISNFSLIRFKSSYSQTLVFEPWVRSSTLRSILMILMSIGMLFFLLKSLSCFLRIGFSLKMSGVP